MLRLGTLGILYLSTLHFRAIAKRGLSFIGTILDVVKHISVIWVKRKYI